MSCEPHTFIIKGELYSSKNSRLPLIYKDPRGKTIRKVIKSHCARDHERHLLQLFTGNPAFCATFRQEAEGRPLPLKLNIKIYRRTRQRFDYTNICQNLFDCMVKCRLLPDDSADQLLPVFEPYEVDNLTPRVEMKLLP
ncbi:MAG: hypothetical protein HKK66_02970 [Chlorobiaceae bacterium]|nr:hypothetical protein [Chlorobiaceae bacterium]